MERFVGPRIRESIRGPVLEGLLNSQEKPVFINWEHNMVFWIALFEKPVYSMHGKFYLACRCSEETDCIERKCEAAV